MSDGGGPSSGSSAPSPKSGADATSTSAPGRTTPTAAPDAAAGAAAGGSGPASRTTSHTGGNKARRRSSRTGRRRKPQEFMMPDGRRVLVALPEDAAALRDKYAGVMREAAAHGGEGMPQVEVVVHGSPEHMQFLQESQAHHQSRREALKAKYGPEILDEWDRVTADFNQVSTELEKLEDHSASLGHNFSKFGYSATLRTFGGDEHGGGHGGGGYGSGSASASSSRRGSQVGSSATSVASDSEDDEDSGSGDDGGKSGVPVWHNQNNGQIMQIFKRPVVKQYFHRGLLWRASEETSVQSFELFFDLLYVGIIAVNGDHAAESADGFELLRFLVTFCLSWKIWSDVTQLVSWFSTNDVIQRVEILFLFACLLGVTVNMVQTFYGWGSTGEHSEAAEPSSEGGGSAERRMLNMMFWRREEETTGTGETLYADTYPALAAYYVTARLFMALYCFVTGLLVPLVQGTMFCQVALIVVGAALWIASIHLSMPVRLACVFVALAFDLFGGSLVVGLFRYANSHTETRFGRYLITKVFDFYPAMNIEHKVERTSAFISLVLGYSVVGVLYQSSHGYGVNAFLGKAVLGLVQAFIFNWIYFDIDCTNIHVHAIRRRAETAYIWQYAHLLFTLAFILSSAALTRFVVATDCSNAPYDSLTEMYQERSSPELSLGLRLYYSTGLGVSLFSMTLIALCHQHKIPPTARLPKWARMANRLVVSAIFCALPAAQRLSSLSVMSIATGLIGWVLIVEIYGQSCAGDRLFETRETGGYTARCSQRRLRKALRDAQRELDGDVENGGQPNIDVNVLSQGQKHGAIYME